MNYKKNNRYYKNNKYNNRNNRNNNYKKHYQYYKKKRDNHNDKLNIHNVIEKNDDLVIEEKSFDSSNEIEFKNNSNDNILLNKEKEVIDNHDVVSSINNNSDIKKEDIFLEEPVLIKKENHLVIKNDIDNEKNIKKKPIFRYILGPLLIILVLLGTTYAYFTYYEETTSQGDIIAGEVYIKLKESPAPVLTINKIYPRTDEEARARSDNYVDFTILGKNTSSNMDLGYKFSVSLGDVTPGKISVDSENLKFDIYSLDSENNETPILSGVSFNDVNGPIPGLVVSRNTLEEISRKYRLRVWMKDTVIISDTESNRTYTQEQFNKLMANISVNVMNGEINNTPTISSCPNCRFMYTTKIYYYGGANNPNATNITDIKETISNDYRDVITNDRKYFLGFTESNGKIDKAYTCGIKKGTPFCIEGALDDSNVGNSSTRQNTYTANSMLLQGVDLWNDLPDEYDRNVATNETSTIYEYPKGSDEVVSLVEVTESNEIPTNMLGLDVLVAESTIPNANPNSFLGFNNVCGIKSFGVLTCATTRITPLIQASANDIIYGQDEIVTINVPSGLSGTINIYLNDGLNVLYDNIYFYTDGSNNELEYTFPSLNGNHPYYGEIIFTPDDTQNYNSSNAVFSFFVSLAGPIVDVDGEGIDIGPDDIEVVDQGDGTIVVIVPEILNSQIIKVNADGNNFYGEVTNGAATIELTGLSSGTYEIEVSVLNYAGLETTAYITIP